MLLAKETPAQVISDPEGSFFPRAAEVTSGISYRTWSIKPKEGEDFRLGQFVLPVYVHSVLHENVEISYLFNVADSDLDLGPAEGNRLSGVTDGKLALTYFPDRHFSAGLGVRVPTGESRLEPEEETIARELAERIFGFRVKRYGEGLDVEARGGYATLLDRDLAVSAGAAYLVKGEFKVLNPIDQLENTYQPGNEFSVLAAANGRALGSDWAGRFQFTTFETDRRDGADEIQEGNEAGFRLRVRDEYLAGIVDFEVDALWKAETEIVSAGGLPPTRDVGGNILRTGGMIRSRMNRRSELSGRAGVNWYGETKRGIGDGLIFEAGVGLRRTLAAGFDLGLGYTLFLGNAEDRTIDLTGHDVTLSLNLRHGDTAENGDGIHEARMRGAFP